MAVSHFFLFDSRGFVPLFATVLLWEVRESCIQVPVSYNRLCSSWIYDFLLARVVAVKPLRDDSGTPRNLNPILCSWFYKYDNHKNQSSPDVPKPLKVSLQPLIKLELLFSYVPNIVRFGRFDKIKNKTGLAAGFSLYIPSKPIPITPPFRGFLKPWFSKFQEIDDSLRSKVVRVG